MFCVGIRLKLRQEHRQAIEERIYHGERYNRVTPARTVDTPESHLSIPPP
jgi:hypothetical protein